MADTAAGSLRKVITVRHAVAIYVSSVLGAGILVIPGLAARAAGAGSLLAWGSWRLRATLSRSLFPASQRGTGIRRDLLLHQGGVRSRNRHDDGLAFVAWVVLGAPAITLAAGTYLAYAVPISGSEVFLVAAAIVILAYAINLQGIRLSGRVQLALVTIMVAVLSVAVAASAPETRTVNFVPFPP